MGQKQELGTLAAHKVDTSVNAQVKVVSHGETCGGRPTSNPSE
jgi:hypothetical protein